MFKIVVMVVMVVIVVIGSVMLYSCSGEKNDTEIMKLDNELENR